MVAGGQHHHGVEVRGEHVAPVGEHARGTEALGASLGRGLCEIAHRRELKCWASLRQVRQVHHLGNHPATDDPNPYWLSQERLPVMFCGTFHGEGTRPVLRVSSVATRRRPPDVREPQRPDATRVKHPPHPRPRPRQPTALAVPARDHVPSVRPS